LGQSVVTRTSRVVASRSQGIGDVDGDTEASQTLPTLFPVDRQLGDHLDAPQIDIDASDRWPSRSARRSVWWYVAVPAKYFTLGSSC
jgi:hypothetical protein